MSSPLYLCLPHYTYVFPIILMSSPLYLYLPHYTYVLYAIQGHIRRLTGRDWLPDEFICDFEQALISLIEDEFPLSQIDGCYFHFIQSLWKVGELGLINHYRNDVILKSITRKLMTMGFNFIIGTFHILSTSNLVRRLMVTYPALVDFFSYVRDIYTGCLKENTADKYGHTKRRYN